MCKGVPAVCNASAEVGGAKPARLTDLTTGPRLVPPLPSRRKSVRKRMLVKAGEEMRNNSLEFAVPFVFKGHTIGQQAIIAATETTTILDDYVIN